MRNTKKLIIRILQPLLIIVIVFPICLACQGPLNSQSYIKEVRIEGNGIRKKVENGEYYFDLQFQPAEYLALQRLGGRIGKTSDFQSKVTEMKSLQYFTLVIGTIDSEEDFVKKGTKNEKEQSDKIYFFSYTFQESISLTNGEETIRPVLYHFERSVDLRNSRTFVLGFEPFNSTNPIVELDISPGFFGSEPLKIPIDKSKSPKLSI